MSKDHSNRTKLASTFIQVDELYALVGFTHLARSAKAAIQRGLKMGADIVVRDT